MSLVGGCVAVRVLIEPVVKKTTRMSYPVRIVISNDLRTELSGAITITLVILLLVIVFSILFLLPLTIHRLV